MQKRFLTFLPSLEMPRDRVDLVSEEKERIEKGKEKNMRRDFFFKQKSDFSELLASRKEIDSLREKLSQSETLHRNSQKEFQEKSDSLEKVCLNVFPR
jgi:hypothetical protein